MELSAAKTLDGDQQICVKVNKRKTGDHISAMPDEILNSILSLLTMREAVKTRVLSPRWSYLSAATSDLQFDASSIFGTSDHRGCSYQKALDLWHKRHSFLRAVNQFLEHFRIKNIYSFKVSYCLGNESARYINDWIGTAVRMQTEKLDLSFLGVPEFCQLYNFPCHLRASQLKHLCLKSCRLRTSRDSSNIFNSLKTLHLSYIPLNEGVFDSIVSGCTNLECLRLEKCCLPDTFSICERFLCLKSLVMHGNHGTTKIVVSSIVLTTFEYIGAHINISFVGVPFIEKVKLGYIRASKSTAVYMFNGLAKDLPQLQILSLSMSTSQVWQIPDNVTKFDHLKELELFVSLSSEFDLLSVASILNAAPYLQKFHLALRYGEYKNPEVKRRYSKNCYYHLKEIKISGFRDRCNALDLAIYMVSSAFQLERLIIDCQKMWNFGCNYWINFSYPTLNEFQKGELQNVLLKENPNLELIFL